MKTLIGILFAFSLTAATPDCMKQYHFSNRSGDVGQYGQEFVAITTGGNNVSSSYNNTIYQCNSWLVSYSSEGLSGLSLQFESAPNSYSSGNTAGTFVAFAGTAGIGSNPMSTTTSNYYTGTGYYPWLRMNLVSKTGTGSMDIVMQGWKSPAYIGAIIPSSATGTTQAAGDNSTKIATTAYVDRVAPWTFLHGNCGGAASSGVGGVAFDLLGGNVSSGACNAANGVNFGTILTRACTLQNMYIRSSAGGADASDGVFTPIANASTVTGITCTTGVAATCTDTTHTYSASAGDVIWVKATTDSVNLANLAVSIECH